MTKSADLVQGNAQVFHIYYRRLANPADPDIFITAARKLTTFLSDKRAYYAEAQKPIIEILEIACNSLKNVAPNVFSKPGSLDRSAIPAEKAPLFDAFNKLANSITPYAYLFADATLHNRLVSFLSSIGISLPGNAPPPKSSSQISATSSTRRQADPTAPQAQSPLSIGSASPEIMELGLPSTAKGATSVQLSTSAPEQPLSLEAKGDDSGTVVQLTSNRLATQSPVGELRAPVSGDVVNLARGERNRNVRAPAPSLSTSSSFRTDSASPVSAFQVVSQSSQKIPDNTPVTPSPASANLTSQGPNLQSISPGQVWVAQIPQSQGVPIPQVKSPVQTSASVPFISASSGQNEPRPPRRRQSSGLDFLQLDLQVARQKKMMVAKLASEAQKSGTTQAPPDAGPSPFTKDGSATAIVSPTSTTTASIPNTQMALTSTPTVLAAAQTPARTPGTQMVQTPSPTLVHRDLRQESSRVRTSSGSPRKLRITDRAPVPALAPGTSDAPIVIDEEEVSIPTPADEPMEVDVIMQPRTQTEETPIALDSDYQNVQGSYEDAKGDHKPQYDQEGKALPEQRASLHDKPSGSRLEPTKDQDSVEGLGPSNNGIVSGATIVPSLGNESPVLSKDSTHAAIGIISAPKGKDTEMTPPAPTTTVTTAIATESTISIQSVVVGSSNPGIVTLGVRPQEEKGSSEMSVDPSLPMGQAASQTPTISSGNVSTLLIPPTAPHPSTESLSDMDISSPTDTPPIAVLGAHASGSRSTSSQSEKRSSEGGTEPFKAEEVEEDASEMVDELAPLFGKEMKVICMDRAYDVPGEFTWGFNLSHADWDRISQWVKASENLDFDVSQARCITLACYLMKELDPYATQNGLLREQWFENVKPVPWANLPRTLWTLINDEVTAMFPPYLSPDDLFDLSPFLRVGHNKISFTQIDGMAEYVLVLHGHLPTRGQLVPLKARWAQERHFREQLSLLSRPFIIDDW